MTSGLRVQPQLGSLASSAADPETHELFKVRL